MLNMINVILDQRTAIKNLGTGQINLLGNTFNKLTVVALVKGKRNKPQWNCRCVCGNTVKATTNDLQLGIVKSCGCDTTKVNDDLTGIRFDKLVVIKPVLGSNTKKNHWVCECDCGTVTEVYISNLKSGATKSCGRNKCKTLIGRAKDLTGARFGRLVVIKPVMELPNKNKRWVCECDCGNVTNVYGGNLKSGATKSCGCGKRIT